MDLFNDNEVYSKRLGSKKIKINLLSGIYLANQTKSIKNKSLFEKASEVTDTMAGIGKNPSIADVNVTVWPQPVKPSRFIGARFCLKCAASIT